MSPRVTVRVPASVSNLGAGFDCVGVAVDRWLRLDGRIEPSRRAPLSIERHGTLRALTVRAEDDLLYRGFAAACRVADRPVPLGVRLHASSQIPLARGLGSSAAALVAGAAVASALVGLSLSRDAIFGLAADVEGHRDNVAAAVFGGARLVVPGPNGASALAPLAVHRSLSLVLAIPDFAVATAQARSVLPTVVPFDTAVVAAARAAALVAGLRRADAKLLAAALDDVLHVPHRRALVPGYDAVTAAARAAGAFGATLSGSGSSIVALAPGARARAVAAAMSRAWLTVHVRARTFEVQRPAPPYELVSSRAARRRAPSRNRSLHV